MAELVAWLEASGGALAVGATLGAAVAVLFSRWRGSRRVLEPEAERRTTTLSRRVDDLEHRNLELIRLFVLLPDLARTLAGTTDRHEIVRLLVEYTQDLLPEAAATAFFACASERAAPRLIYGTGTAAGHAGLQLPAGKGLIGHACRTNDLATPERVRSQLSAFELGALFKDDPTPFSVFAAMPVQYAGARIGALAIAHPGSFWQATGPVDPRAADPLRLLSVVADVGAITLMHAANLGRLAESNALLQKLDRLKSEFLAMASHDLRTPLTSIRAAVDNLRDGVVGDISDRQRDYLALMSSETQRLVRLINDLLDLQRIEQGGVELRRHRVHLRLIAERALKVLLPGFARRSLSVDIDGLDGSLAVHADADRVNQILFNLLDNAAKYAPDGGRVTVAATAEGDDVAVTVTNSGEPLPEGLTERIFDRFEQVDVSEESGPIGVGLGLAIARQLVAMHGGKIGARGVPGVGTRFTFTLPRSPLSADDPDKDLHG